MDNKAVNKLSNFSICGVENFDSAMSAISNSSNNSSQSKKFNTEMDCNENYITKETTGEIENSKFEAKITATDSITNLVPIIKGLHLSQENKSNDNNERLAGYIKAVIPPTGTVIIQLAAGSKILDLDTIIFIQKDNADESCIQEYEEIGFISDIFGSISEPMYALELKQRSTGDLLKIDSKVFYSENSNTKYINVRCEADNSYTVIYN